MKTKEMVEKEYAVVGGIFNMIVVCGSTSLYHHTDDTRIGNDLDCIIASEQILGFCDRILKSIGGRVIYDFAPRGKYDLRKSYKLPNGKKVEFFIDPVEGRRTQNTGLQFCSQKNIWAAREYYTAKLNSGKYKDQITWSKVAKAAILSNERYQVGALYIAPDGVESTGHNHHPNYCGHAEVAAIRKYEKANFKRAVGGAMYCTLSPCTECAKLLAERGMEIHFVNEYTGKL